MKRFFLVTIAALTMFCAGLFCFPAVALDEDICDLPGSSVAGCGESTTAPSVISIILNTVVGIVGVISVIFIIIGGYMYSVSSGDPGKAKKAKDTILYAVIGLVVSLLSFAIINFVLSNVIS